MRACIQRVSQASVHVGDLAVGAIDCGLVILVGIASDDNMSITAALAEKIAHLRIFDDEHGKMNRSVRDIGGSALVVSQFTLYADCSRGRRPSYTQAAQPELAEKLYMDFIASLRGYVSKVECGRFRAHMQVQLTNDGPVTIWIEQGAD